MATIKGIKAQLKNANALGVANLTEKGVEISENATTYQIMQSIAEISGGGVQYTDIVYNDDDTITFTDTDGVVHTMECEYNENGKLQRIIYDEKKVPLTYDGDMLVKIGNTTIDMGESPVAVSVGEDGVMNLDWSMDDDGNVII